MAEISIETEIVVILALFKAYWDIYLDYTVWENTIFLPPQEKIVKAKLLFHWGLIDNCFHLLQFLFVRPACKQTSNVNENKKLMLPKLCSID